VEQTAGGVASHVVGSADVARLRPAIRFPPGRKYATGGWNAARLGDVAKIQTVYGQPRSGGRTNCRRSVTYGDTFRWAGVSKSPGPAGRRVMV